MVIAIVLLLIISTSSVANDTITLQTGLNGYNGCQDVTIFNEPKAEHYSWQGRPKPDGYQSGVDPDWRAGHPYDPVLVFSDFVC